MFIDEAVWRAEHGTLPQKREALCHAFAVDLWEAEQQEVRLGVGGGYGQFGILSEEEFNALIKMDGKRVQKFTEHPDQFKKVFNRNRYPEKNTGIRFVRGVSSSGESGAAAEGQDAQQVAWDEEIDSQPAYKYGYREEDEDNEAGGKSSAVEAAKLRFDFQPDIEKEKLRKLMNEGNRV